MSETWLVMKFGGTSVAGRAQWQVIESLVRSRRDAGFRVCVVCSALAGITDELTDLARAPSPQRAAAIVARHAGMAAELGLPFEVLGQRAEEKLQALAARTAKAKASDDAADQLLAEYLAVGEWLSTRLGERFLSSSLDTVWADAREALQTLDETQSSRRHWLAARCNPGVDTALQRRWAEGAGVVVTQGFLARTPAGDTALLGRGGSDISAALLAGRLAAAAVEIWTDVPGFFTADPRRIKDARLLTQLDYDEALEMAASGARVVHARAIRAAAAQNIPMHIRDTSQPHLPGTHIVANTGARKVASAGGARAIIEQPDMVVLLLQNLDMRQQVGFLARVFAVFARHGVSVDLVATSETTTTVAINRAANLMDTDALTGLVDDLIPICTVKLYDACACINIVGRGVRKSLEQLHLAMGYFREHQLLMLSQSANDLCLSILVNEHDARQLLSLVHRALIPARGGDDVFGACWSALVSEAT